MRPLFGLVIGIGMSTAGAAATAPPTAAEEKTAAAVGRIKGATAATDNALPTGSRVEVAFDAADDDALAAVAKLPCVGAVRVGDATKCTEKGFAALQKLPNLRRLELNKSGVSDVEAAKIAACKELRELIMPESAVTEKGVEHLAKLGRLEKLDLSENPKLGDKAMAHVAKLDRLEFLYLSKTAVTDKGLAELKGLEGLRMLSLMSTKVTEDAAKVFETDMPNLRPIRR